jgi:hypothetical protein
MIDPPNPKLMRLAEFRHRYAVSNSQLYREVKAGRLRIRKLGAASRISCEDAEAWAANLPIQTGEAA